MSTSWNMVYTQAYNNGFNLSTLGEEISEDLENAINSLKETNPKSPYIRGFTAGFNNGMRMRKYREEEKEKYEANKKIPEEPEKKQETKKRIEDLAKTSKTKNEDKDIER
jgi:hypothetical protein